MSFFDTGGGKESFLPERAYEAHAERNARAIGPVLEQVLPSSGTLLEVASGTGQHAVTFAPRFPDLTWITSDPFWRSRESVNAWILHTGVRNVTPPLDLDVTEPGWEATVPQPVAAAYASNLLHITPWPVTLGLFRGLGALLEPGAPVVIYGCFKRDGAHLTPSNALFDRNIRGENAEWGVRDLEEVEAAARDQGLELEEAVDMPTENFCLVLRQTAKGGGAVSKGLT